MFNIEKIIVPAGKQISLKDYDPKFVDKFDKDSAKELLKENKKKLAEIQELFWADA